MMADALQVAETRADMIAACQYVSDDARQLVHEHGQTVPPLMEEFLARRRAGKGS